MTSRGVAARKRCNERAYARKQGIYPSPFLGYMPTRPVPPALLLLACTPFKSGSPRQDTSDLGLMNVPYALRVPVLRGSSTTAGSVGRMEELLRELNGKQFDSMVNAGYARKDRWVALGDAGWGDFVKELENEVECRLTAWIAVHSEGEAMHDACSSIARGVYLHWGAKHVCCIMKEVAAAQKGGLRYLHDCWNNATLPWQCMNMSY